MWTLRPCLKLQHLIRWFSICQDAAFPLYSSDELRWLFHHIKWFFFIISLFSNFPAILSESAHSSSSSLNGTDAKSWIIQVFPWSVVFVCLFVYRDTLRFSTHSVASGRIRVLHRDTGQNLDTDLPTITSSPESVTETETETKPTAFCQCCQDKAQSGGPSVMLSVMHWTLKRTIVGRFTNQTLL